MNHVYIGYDEREDDAFQVCRLSLARRTSQPLHIVKLDQAILRDIGMYDRPWHFEGVDRIDDRDGRPFSTDFTFSRFTVPSLMLFQGWALFCDCDFLFTEDIQALFDLADPQFAAMVVKHSHVPTETIKMDGVTQTRYHRKNWSSIILWNCAHKSNRVLTPELVNHKPGGWLHAFSWLRDEEIGEVPMHWNWLVGVDNWPLMGIPSGIHYTLGVPSMPGHETDPYADLWLEEQNPTPIRRINHG